jgi:DNA adenine methylase
MSIRRPALRYHGGKWKLAPWVMSFFPEHRIYVEAFGGGASLLLRKPRSLAEIYNDLDRDVVSLFRVLQNPRSAERLRRRLSVTPFARDELRRAYEPAVDAVDGAAKMIVRAFMGFGSASVTRTHMTGFRSSTKRHGDGSPPPSAEWGNWPDQVRHFVERLRGVVIENRDGLDVMAQHDTPGTLHYIDPPYLQATRSSLKNRNGNLGHYYKHDMTDADHRRLGDGALALEGMVVVSGYPSPLYDRELFAGWERHECRHMADGARPRTEVLWLNPACSAALRTSRMTQQSLLAEVS